MTTSLVLAEQHRRDQVAERNAFLAAFVVVWRLLTLSDLRGTLAPWAAQATRLTLAHRDRAAERAVHYYAATRAVPRPGIPELPRIEGVVLPQRVERVLRRADEHARRNPLPDTTRTTRFVPRPAPRPSEDDTRRRLTGAVVGRVAEQRREGVVDLEQIGREALAEASRVASKGVLDGGRDTLHDAITADPAAVAWCRITDAHPCSFCAMQASRGFVFKSSDTAGAKYHAGCACTCMPRFREDGNVMPPGNQHWSDLWAQTAGHFGQAEARRRWRRAVDAYNRGADPVEAAFRDTKGQGRRGGQAAEPEPAPRRRVTRSKSDQGTAIRKRLAHMDQALGQLEARHAAGEDLADLIEFHREEIERLCRRAGELTTPDEALVGA